MSSYCSIVPAVRSVVSAFVRIACAVTVIAGCGDGSRPPVAADGWGPSDGLGRAAQGAIELPPPAPRPQAIPKAERQRWRRADELARLTPVPGRGPSEHLSGRYERSVLVNDVASPYTRLLGHRGLPVGALVAQRHHPKGGDAVASWYVMEKVAEDRWTFVVLDPDLALAAEPDVAACQRCHVDAPYDHLFGPAVDAPL
jgi:hypothetical protein